MKITRLLIACILIFTLTIAAASATTDNETPALGDSSDSPISESSNGDNAMSVEYNKTASFSDDENAKDTSDKFGNMDEQTNEDPCKYEYNRLSSGGEDSRENFNDNKYYLFRGDCWIINNNFESSASVTSDTVSDLTITGVFRTESDFVGLYWNSQDPIQHPYITYGNCSNYSDVVLEFDYEMTGCRDLSDTVITIEANTGEIYYLNMNRFIKNNHVKLDFSKLTLLAGNSYINRTGQQVTVLRETGFDVENLKSIMFSIVPVNFSENYTQYRIMENVNFTCRISNISVVNGEICNEQPPLAPHQYRLSEGYDDIYNLNPFRLCKEMRKLGYAEWVDLYIGASNFYEKSGTCGDVIADMDFSNARCEKMVLDKDVPLNNAFRAWLDCYCRELKNNGVSNLIISISMENLQCPQSWRQMDCDGNFARTGWNPSTFFYSPCNEEVIDYVRNVSEACLDILVNNGLKPILQLGEAWWWWSENTLQTPYFYDNSTKAKYLAEHGTPLPEYNDANTAEYDTNATDWLNLQLVKYSDALRDVVKSDRYQDGLYMALFFPPSVTDSDNVPQMMKDVNYLKDAYTPLKLDALQIEDYDWVIFESPHHQEAYAIGQELGFDEDHLHYFGGFVQNPEDADRLWELIEASMDEAMEKNFKEVFVWAGLQVRRDSKILGYDEEKIISNLSSTTVTAPAYASVGESFTITVATQEWIDGNLNVYEYNCSKKGKLLASAAISRGIASADITSNTSGLNMFYLEFDYSGGDYHLIQEVWVVENSKNVTVDIPFEIESETSANITLNAPKSQSASIHISIDKNASSHYSVKDGKFTMKIPDLALGTHTISIKYDDGNFVNGNPAGEVYSNTFKVKIYLKTNLETCNVTADYNSGQYLIAVLKDQKGNALKGKEITVNLNGQNHTLTTNDNGTAALMIDLLPGNYLAEISFIGDETHSQSSAGAYVIVNKIATSFTGNNINVVYNNPANLVITLKDNEDHALAGKDVVIDLNNVKYHKTSDTNGQVRLSLNLPAKNYIAEIIFAGDSIYKSSTLSIKVVVKKATSKLTASDKKFKAKAKNKKVTVTLKNNKNKPVGKVTVKLKLNKKTYKAKTNSKGIATFKFKLTKKGKYNAVYKFAGNSNYKPASKKVKITIK